MGIKNKSFWLVFAIFSIIVAVFIAWAAYNSIYESRVRQVLEKEGIDIEGLTGSDLKEMVRPISSEVKVTDEAFRCENDNSVDSRAYIIILGFGNHDKETFAEENKVILSSPETKGLLTYDYDETKSLDEISRAFAAEANTFISGIDIKELVIIGASAGGNVALYSIEKLNFSGPVELHTIASPLSGYGLTGVKERLIGDRTGFEREIAEGFGQFSVPDNVKVYHHKTVQDSSLVSWCGSHAELCGPLQIQDNNVEGSKEFYYKGENHETIMHKVLWRIIECNYDFMPI